MNNLNNAGAHTQMKTLYISDFDNLSHENREEVCKILNKNGTATYENIYENEAVYKKGGDYSLRKKITAKKKNVRAFLITRAVKLRNFYRNNHLGVYHCNALSHEKATGKAIYNVNSFEINSWNCKKIAKELNKIGMVKYFVD